LGRQCLPIATEMTLYAHKSAMNTTRGDAQQRPAFGLRIRLHPRERASNDRYLRSRVVPLCVLRDGCFVAENSQWPLDDGKSIHVELDDPYEHDTRDDGDDGDHKPVTPEPSSVILLGSGLFAVSRVLLRKSLM